MRNFVTYEWLTVFCIFGLALVAIAKSLFSLRFNDFLLVIGNSKYLKIYSRDQKFIDSFDSLLFANMVIATSMFIYFVYQAFVGPLDFEIIWFLKLLFATSTIFLIKILIERLIGSLFSVDGLVDSYLFQKTTYKNFSGIVLMGFNILLLYGIKSTKVIIISILILICLINTIGFITSFKNHQKLLISHFFYFLLYLCALEIGPYILLYKVIKEYNA
ncbi:MAG: DUF4271 domain-containing protein [Bacteroidota bacterium]